MWQTLWKILKCSRGQMAIFVALIFQVLFVFFAMVINIGLLVHDKINLQNSVDLAAYYAASKQAEVLNALGHINFQIRQSYKLLAYRLRVVGGFGYIGHPAHDFYPGAYTESLHTAPIGEGSSVLIAEQPAVCITHRQWKDFADGERESLCRSATNVVTEIPSVPVIFALNPLNAATSNYIEQIKQQIGETCRRGGLANWRYAAMINYIFKRDVAKRKVGFLTLATSLAQTETNFKDLDGNDVKEGVIKTLTKNLTAGNRSGLSGEEIYFYNSLGSGAQNSRPQWIAEQTINPIIRYILHQTPQGTSCANYFETISTFPSDVNIADPGGAFRMYIGEPANTDINHSSKGFEKNPWHMAYVAVRAKTTPRLPFSPFGGAVELKAVAFAKPFGGRIGPWETVSWQRGADKSNPGARAIDPLAVPRNDRLQPSGNMAQDTIFLPNYSKYPGDKFGSAGSP